MAGQIPPPQSSPDGNWWWDGARWVPADGADRGVIRRFDRARLVGLFVITARLWTLLPIGIAVFMAVDAPTYFRPMFSAPLGIGLLAAGVVAVVGGYGMIEVGARLTRRGGARLAWGLVLICAVCLLQFFVLWIVLLGPALVILSTATGS